MKKILFVIFTEDFSWGVSILASLAHRHGWTPDILFLPHDAADARFLDYAESFRPDVVAISFMSYDRQQAVAVAELSRRLRIPTIAGGVHPTFLPADVIATGLFAAVVVGDGMGVLEELLDGVVGCDPGAGRLVQGRRHADRSLYTNLFHSSAQIARMQRTRSAMLLSSQGCPYQCRFCASGALDYLSYSPEEIVAMAERLHQGYGVVNFQFFDDLFAISARRCRSIHQAFLDRFGEGAGIKYGNFVQARASTFSTAIAEEIAAMGIQCVNFGIETTSAKLLKFLNKAQTPEQCYEAMRICKEFGLVRKVNLMFGIPTQDERDYQATLRFVEDTNPEIKTCFFYVPMPGSALYDYCFDHGYLPPGADRSRFDWFEHRPDGFADVQCRLLQVDYAKAREFKERIERADDQIDYLRKQVLLVDRRPWVILGTSKTYYFKRFIERIASLGPSRCMGYLDLDDEGGFVVEGSLPIKKLDARAPIAPALCTTYCRIDGEDFQFIRRAADERFGAIPLISLASFANHPLEEIDRMIAEHPMQGASHDR